MIRAEYCSQDGFCSLWLFLLSQVQPEYYWEINNYLSHVLKDYCLAKGFLVLFLLLIGLSFTASLQAGGAEQFAES